MSLLEKDPKFSPYHRIGLCRMSVCGAKHLTPEEVTELANLHSPTGISSGWVLSKETNFPGGEPNPCPCNDSPNERVHYLMEC